MVIAMAALATNSASRVRAPAWTSSAEADSEPPTGSPRNSAETRLPTPWPRMSRVASGG